MSTVYFFIPVIMITRYLSSIAAVLLTLKLGSVHSQRAALLCPLFYHAIVALCQYFSTAFLNCISQLYFLIIFLNCFLICISQLDLSIV